MTKHELEHEFTCYKLWASPFIIKNFRKNNKKLNDKMNEIDFFTMDRVLTYMVKEGRTVSSNKILNFIKKIEKG